MSKKNSNSNIKIQKTNYLYWFIYNTASKIIMALKNGYKCDRKEFKVNSNKEGCLLIYNHVSNMDHFASTAAVSRHIQYVISKYFYFNKFLSHFLNGVCALPKDQFSADMASIKLMKRAIENKKMVAIAPAGQITVHGGMIFIDPAIVKLVRLCKANVFAIQIRGNYLSYPKWSTAKRKAKVRTKFVTVIKKEDIATLSDEEIYQRICDSINVHDIKEQDVNKIKIRSKARAAGIENILYVCPKCRSEYKIVSEKHHFWCTECNNKVYFNEYGVMESASVNNVRFVNEEEWYKWETNLLYKQIEKGTLHLERDCTLYRNINEPWKMEEFAKGKIILTNDVFYFEGIDTLGNQYHKEFNLERIFQLPWKPNVHFEITGDEEGKFKVMCDKQPNAVVEFVQAIDALRVYKNKK